MADINQIAQQFAEFYYGTFDTDRKNLVPLYRDQSMLTFEGQQFQGASNIVEKLSSLPFQQVKHKILTIDCQPSSQSQNSLMVFVTGQLLIDQESNPQQFCQVFHLIPEGNSYWVFNDVFRLNYG